MTGICRSALAPLIRLACARHLLPQGEKGIVLSPIVQGLPLRAGRVRGLSAVALACAVAFATLAQAADQSVRIYRGATVIDGTGTAAKPDMAIVTRGEQIEAVIPAAQAARYAKGATAIDAQRLYALPGLIDSHVHLATA